VSTIDQSETILSIVRDKKPKSVKELTQMVHDISDLPEDEVIDLIQVMYSEGLIKLKDSNVQSVNLRDYLLCNDTLWYWTMVSVGVIAISLVFLISESSPLFYARNVLGLIFVLFLPGYALIRVLFPINVPMVKTRQLQTIERVALSIGNSIVLVTIVGLFNYYAPWGLDLFVIDFILLILTLLFSTAALFREYQAKKQFY
jgi:uncharacterized membrane protein